MVSVIVPVYNVEKYLTKCIDSLVNQTLKDIEIILVDDGSTDTSGKICDQYAKEHKNIIVLHKANSGQSDARNEGLKIAKGDYIGFVDSDDWVDNTFYEKMYHYALKNNLDMVVSDRKVYDSNDNEIYVTKFTRDICYCIFSVEDYFYNYFFKYTPSSCNKIYKKNKLSGIYMQPVSKVGSEDALFNFQIMLTLKKVVEVKNIYYNSLARENSTARNYNGRNLVQNYNLLNECLLSIFSQNIDKSICYHIFNFFQQRTWIQIKNYAGGEVLKELDAEINDIKKIRDYRNICLNMLKLKNLNKMGYRFKGIVAIKITYLLKLLDLNKFLVKYIYCLFIRGRV